MNEKTAIETLKNEFDLESALAKRLLSSLTISNGWYIVTPRLLRVLHRHHLAMEAMFHLFTELERKTRKKGG